MCQTAWSRAFAVTLTAGLAVISGLHADQPLALGLASAIRVGVSQNVVVAAFEQYAAGEFDAAVEKQLRGRRISALGGEFRRDAGAWIDQAPVPDRSRRLAIVAAMSVELMAASFSQGIVEYVESRVLVEWACERLRLNAATEFERRFYLASIALMQGARDEPLLYGVHFVPALIVAIPGGGSHVLHAGRRFAGESRFKLAYVTVGWETQTLATWPLTPANLVRDQVGRPFTIEKSDDLQRLDNTWKVLASFFNDPAVGHEARLRSGVLRFARSQTAAARSDLDVARESGDPAIRHVAHLMLGTIADQAGQPAEALKHYQQAYESVPASSSSIALASSLYRAGRQADAAELLRVFASKPPPPDPWRLYGQRDFRFFNAYRDAMRQAAIQ